MLTLPKTWGAVFMVSGTCIGAAMLALPVVAAPLGLWGAVALLCMSWFFMYVTGLMTLEANLHLPVGANFIRMAGEILGYGWGRLTTVVYAMLLYALMAAYFNGLVNVLSDALTGFMDAERGRMLYTSLVMLVVGAMVAGGTAWVDRLNRGLVFLLFLAYMVLLWLLFPHVHTQPHLTCHLPVLVLAAPVVVTSFGFHVLVPNLRDYLQSRVQPLRRVLLWGSLLPLVIYLLWTVILFVVLPPAGVHSLLGLHHAGSPEVGVIHAMVAVAHAPITHWMAQNFIFFAILSSLLGIALSMVHFLKDGIRYVTRQQHVGRKGHLLALGLAFFPPWLFAVYEAHGFLLALQCAGLFVAYLHGILPAMMVRRLRLQKAHGAAGASASLGSVRLVLAVSLILVVGQLVLFYRPM